MLAPKFPTKRQELQVWAARGTTWCKAIYVHSSPFCFTDALHVSAQKIHSKTTSPQTHLRQRHVGSPDNIENHAGSLVDGELQKRRDYRPDSGILRASLRTRMRSVDGGGGGDGGRVIQVGPAGRGGGWGSQSVRRNLGDPLLFFLAVVRFKCECGSECQDRKKNNDPGPVTPTGKPFTHQAGLVTGREGEERRADNLNDSLGGPPVNNIDDR